MIFRRHLLRALCAVLPGLFAACSGAESTSADGAGKVSDPATSSPVRIVPANTAAAEFVLALVDSSRLAAIPEQLVDYSTLIEAHPSLAKLPRFPRYVAEPVLAARPDLVVTHTWQAGDTTSVLTRAGIRVFVLDSVLEYEGLRTNLARLGDALGARARADEVVRGLDARVAVLKAGAARRSGKRALLYSNSGTGGTAAASGTTADGLLHMVGLTNAAAGLTGHVSLDFEKVLELAPDVFIVSRPARGEGGSATRVVLESTAALASLRAIREHRIVVLSSAELSTDSPTLVDAAESLAAEYDRVFGP